MAEEIEIKLTPDEILYILKILGFQPHNQVDGLMCKIKDQIINKNDK